MTVIDVPCYEHFHGPTAAILPSRPYIVCLWTPLLCYNPYRQEVKLKGILEKQATSLVVRAWGRSALSFGPAGWSHWGSLSKSSSQFCQIVSVDHTLCSTDVRVGGLTLSPLVVARCSVPFRGRFPPRGLCPIDLRSGVGDSVLVSAGVKRGTNLGGGNASSSSNLSLGHRSGRFLTSNQTYLSASHFPPIII